MNETVNCGHEDIVVHDTDGTPAVVIRPGEPIHVFGNVDVFTGRYGAEEKLAELAGDDEVSVCEFCDEAIVRVPLGEWVDDSGHEGCAARTDLPHRPTALAD